MPKPENLLMSYIVCDMLSKSDQTVAHDAWVRIIEDISESFKAAGATRQTVSQIWNREGTFKLGFMWEYKDEKAFVQCQSLFREAEVEFQKRTGILENYSNSRHCFDRYAFLASSPKLYKSLPKRLLRSERLHLTLPPTVAGSYLSDETVMFPFIW